MIRPVIIGLLTLIAPVSPVQAAEAGLSGAQLMAYCAGHYDVDAGFCAGYVTALADVMKEEALFGRRACNLGPVPSQQLMELVRIEGNDNQADTAQPAVRMVSDMLGRYYRCR